MAKDKSARAKPAERDASEVRATVEAALDRHGFPFELEVGRAFRGARFFVQHAVLYSDPETKKVREIDVVATETLRLQDAKPDDPSLQLTLTVECKRTAKDAWVVFSSPRSLSAVSASLMGLPGRVAAVVLGTYASETAFQAPLSLFAIGQRAGHGIQAIQLDNQSQSPGAYDAVRSALNAAEAFTAQFERRFRSALPRRGSPTIELFAPVVLLDGSLFEYSLTEAGKPVLSEIDRAHLLWYQSGAPAPVVINVVRRSGLDAFLKDVAEDTDRLRKGVLPSLREIVTKFSSQVASTPD